MLPLLRLLGPYVVWLYPIGVLTLLYYLRVWLLANRDLRSSLFTVERETALARMRRSASGAFVVFGLLVGLFFIQFFLGPEIDITRWIQPTATPDFNTRVAYVPTPTLPNVTPEQTTPGPTATRRPTPRPITLVPSPTKAAVASPVPVAPANCSTPGIQITQPGSGAQVRGRVEIRGSAAIPNFQFYKIELGLGEHPTGWTSIAEIRRSPVTNGLLEVWDTSGLPAGTYSLRLVVVDLSGNYRSPCEVQVVVAR